MPVHHSIQAGVVPSLDATPTQVGGTPETRVLADVALAISRIAAKVAPGAEVHRRIKTARSRGRKEMRDSSAAMDSLGVRVIVTEVSHCFSVIAQVHAVFGFLRSEYDDYIARPKANGYRSLHTVVLHSSGAPVELQVRTREMHTAAVTGTAAHWRYKRASEESDAKDRAVRVPTRFATPLDRARRWTAPSPSHGDPSPTAGSGAP